MSVEPEALMTVETTLTSLEAALTRVRAAVAQAEVQLRESREFYQHLARVARRTVDAAPASIPGGGRLTRQELRVAILVAEGKRNLEVAAQYHVSVHTVKSQVKSILRKLDLESRWQLREVLSVPAADWRGRPGSSRAPRSQASSSDWRNNSADVM